MNRILLTALFAFAFLSSQAQIKGSVSGVLVDNTKHSDKIEYATISVYNQDSTLVSYKLSDSKGSFTIPSLPAGKKYRMVITAFQYETFRKEIAIAETNRDVKLDTIFLVKRVNTMKEVVIMSERPPIIVRNDTIEFNAESFKTLPTAVVEDLLKKLPGINISANGEIIFNGLTVSRILVDGKEFFGSNIQVASKNLPSNIVDKVQIMDDNDVKRRNPNLNAADIPQVINLTLKRGIKQGVFGKLYAGLGLNSYFENGGILNAFRDTTQVSLIGFANNVNKSAFTLSDVKRIGGFERGGYNSLRTDDGGFSIDNVSFGGIGNGIQKTVGGGLNFNTLFKNGVKVNARYFYGHSKIDLKQINNDNQTLKVGSLNTLSNLNNDYETNSHNIGAKITLNPNKLLELIIVPSIDIVPKVFDNLQSKISTSETGLLENTSIVTSYKDALNLSYKLNTYLYKDFLKKGRRLYVGLSLTKTNNDEYNYNYSNSFFTSTNSTYLIDQLRQNNINNFDWGVNLVFSEPISKKLKLSVEVLGNSFDNENALFTFYKNSFGQDYDIIAPSLSETVRQTGLKTNSIGRLVWTGSKNLSIQPGLIFSTINIQNSFVNYNDFNQSFLFVNPSLNIRYKTLSVDYQQSFTEPIVQYLQPVSNNIDPLFIQKGNTGLVPAKTHRLFVFFNKFDFKKGLVFNFNINGSSQSNGTIMSRVIDANSVQTNTPINVSGIRQISHNGSVIKTIKGKTNQFSINAGYSINLFDSPIEVNKIRSNSLRMFLTPSFGFRVNFNDKVELFENYYLSYSKSTYEDPFFRDLAVTTHTSDSEIILRLVKKLVLEGNLKLQLNNQNIAGYNNSIKILNLGCTYLFMKNDRAQLKVSVNDVFQNNVKRYVSITENFIRDTQINNIGRYGMVTLTYNIQNFKGKVGGKERFLGF